MSFLVEIVELVRMLVFSIIVVPKKHETTCACAV
jgi:hypothetical protein